MQRSDTAEYFRRRAAAERAAAEQASDERAAHCHRDLAARYDELALGGVVPGHLEPQPHEHGTLPRDLNIFP